MKELSSYVRTIPDFPIPGIMFRDITGILDSAEGFAFSIDELAKRAEKLQFDLVAGIESRGFIFAAPLALRFQKPFIPFRKKGKLPGKTIRQEFKLEYGSSILEVNENAVRPGQRVLIVDDLIATGGSAKAGQALVERLGGTVAGFLFVIELPSAKGRDALAPFPVESLISFEGD